MDGVVFQLAVVFVPGLIWTTIVDRLCTTRGERSNFSTMVRAFGFGIASYVIYFTIFAAVWRATAGKWPAVLNGMSTAPGVSELKAVQLVDILFASAAACVLGVGWSWAANRKLFTRAMHKLGVSRKFGDEGVWEFALNMGTAAVEYVNIRYFENRVIYAGYVRAFSEGGEIREVLLDQARVFDLDSGDKLFEMPIIYLSRKADALHVEFPYSAKVNAGDQK